MSESIETVVGILREVLDETPDLGISITAETSFSNDLELESIELVGLIEKLQARYGDDVDFVGWLSQKELDEIIQLRVGDVAAFIDRCLSSTPTD